MKHFSLLVFFCLIFLKTILYSQKTIIEGYIPNSAGKCIRMYSFEDFMSYQPLLIAKDTIRQSNYFRFDLPLKQAEVKVIYFAIERYKSAELLVAANRIYVFNFDSIDFSHQDRYYSPLAYNFPMLNVHIKPDTSDLNYIAIMLNEELSSFSLNIFPQVVASRNRQLLQNFRKRLDSIFAFVKHPFMRVFIDYSFAEIEFISGLYSREYFIGKYMHDIEFHYDNPAFMNFFHVFFDKYIYTSSSKIYFRDLHKHINQQPNYRILLDSLGKDHILVNEVIRDMVLIKNVHQMYIDQVFSRDTLCLFLKTISTESKFSRHRKIAQNLLHSMEFFNKRSLDLDLPKLIFKDSQGKHFHLDTLTNMYTYMLFFTTYSLDCLRELQALKIAYNKFKNHIRFLAVSMDVEFLQFYYFMQENSYPWITVNFNKNFEFEDYLQLKVFPQAVLVSPNGKIINLQAPLPSENLVDFFNSLLKFK